MSDAADLTAAQALCDLYVPQTVEPAHTAAERDAVLARVKRASTWAASTLYQVGDVVLPTVRNGHRYRAVTGGTSSTTEPNFSRQTGSLVSDGSDLKWAEDGPDYANIYDVRAALHALCSLKLARASDWHTAEAHRVREHWAAMVQHFGPIQVG